VWLVRNRNGIVTFVEDRIMAFLQFSSALEKAANAPEMYLYFPEK